MLLLLSACRDDPTATPTEGPPFTWADTGAAPDGEPALVFSGEAPRNVLVISIDTLRKDALGRYGGAGTPFLDGLAAGGVALDDHLQCSNWTFASTTCTQAGRYLEELGVVPELSAVQTPLPDMDTLARHLRDGGLHGILVSGNTWLSPVTHNAQGFDEASVPDAPEAVAVWRTGKRLLDAARARGEADRWHLHLHLLEPHEPYAPPERYLGALDELAPAPWDLTDHETFYDTVDGWPELAPDQQALLEAHLRARYAGEVRWLDDQLATIFAEAEAAGLLDDTLVVVWSDHGESFFEHGHATHAWTLHAQENDAVALFSAPGLAPLAFAGPTSAVDLFPTVLTALGLPVPSPLSGLPVGMARPDRPRFATVRARSGVEQVVVREGVKLRYHWSGLRQLYDRATDPAELTDRAADRPDEVERLWDLLSPRVAGLRPLVPETPRTP